MLQRTFTRNLLRLNKLVDQSRLVDYAVCIDIECTCDTPVQIHPMEIIELACLKIDLNNPKTTGQKKLPSTFPQFHSFVRPVINPNLTDFCQDLTGITQQVVDKSDTIDRVVPRLLLWLEEQNLVDKHLTCREKFSFASCGNFDMKLLSPIVRDHLLDKKLQLPDYFNQWINVKKIFVNHKDQWPKSLYHMLEMLDKSPEGRPHSALDDCTNLAQVVERLNRDGCKFYPTTWITNKPN